jgi:predicted acetyltransferase
MILRPYHPQNDRGAVHRILREVGWLDRSEEQEEAADLYLGAGQVMVAELAGAAECIVAVAPATYRYLDEDLPLCAVTNVATSRVGRKRGLALRLTALSLAQAAAGGDLLAALGAFEQGYYNQLGFGNGAYDHWFAFDPALLRVAGTHRLPQRITLDDWAEMHAARLVRRRRHGAVSLQPAALTRAEMLYTKNPFGLGYRDGAGGALSHYIWFGAQAVERGPYGVRWLVYNTREQFLELMSIVKSLGDQVHRVSMIEPPGIQLLDLVEKPFKQRNISRNSPYEALRLAEPWWQARILNLTACLAHTHLRGPAVCFNLSLTDPIERYLGPEAPWRGVAGEYVVSLGSSSWAEAGHDPALPTLTASVNAFTRLWIGVRPATGLAFTDELAGPAELLEALDAALQLPRPLPDWMF